MNVASNLANDGAFWSDRPSAFAPSLFCVVDYSLSFGTRSLEYTGLQLHCCSAATTACCWRTTTGKGGEELSCSAVQPWCTPHQLRCTAHLIWWSIADVAFHRLHQDSHGLHRIPNFDKAIGQSASIHGTDHWRARRNFLNSLRCCHALQPFPRIWMLSLCVLINTDLQCVSIVDDEPKRQSYTLCIGFILKHDNGSLMGFFIKGWI